MRMEREFKHTPGPWTVHEQVQKLPGGETVKDFHVFAGQDFICTSWPPESVLFALKHPDQSEVDKITEANAKLIAAAPELLEALKTLVEKCLNSDGYNQKIDELFQAQQAINKATS